MSQAEPNTSRQERQLKTLLVEPFKQIKLGLYVLIITVAFTVLTGVLFAFTFIDQYQHVMQIFNVVDPDVRWELITNDVFQANATRLGLVLFLFVATLFTIVVWSTHRIYGPLISIERFVGQISQGEYCKRVSIRKGDELGRLVDKLNAMAEQLEKRHGAYVEGGRRKDDRNTNHTA